MKKRIKFASAIVIVGLSMFSCVGQSAGQDESILTKSPSFSTNLTSLSLPKGKTIQRVPNRAETGRMEATGHSKLKPNYTKLKVLATAYVSFCDTGCTGITATGLDVRHSIKTPKGYGIIAVDKRVIPLGSVVEIQGKKYKAMDTGGAIRGNHIDVLISTHDTDKAFKFGKKHITIKVYTD